MFMEDNLEQTAQNRYFKHWEAVFIDSLSFIKIALGFILLVLAIYTFKRSEKKRKSEYTTGECDTYDGLLVSLLVFELLALPAWLFLLYI